MRGGAQLIELFHFDRRGCDIDNLNKHEIW